MIDLRTRLESAGLTIAELGDRVLISEFGGRILALAPDGETNLFWINPQTFSRNQIQAWRSGEEWPNLGGDRAWISPEMAANVPNWSRFWGNPSAPDAADFNAAYHVPPSIDPAHYRLDVADDRVELSTTMRVDWFGSGAPIDLELKREVTLLDLPGLPLQAGITFAGYSVATCLSVRSPLRGARPSVWSLLQVPPGSAIVASTYPGCSPTPWFGQPQWRFSTAGVQSDVRGKESYKWSLRASQCRGLFTSELPLGSDRSSLLVRRFPVEAESAYDDCPPYNLQAKGHLCQVYVDDGQLGGFGEIEFHSPGIRGGAGDQTAGEVRFQSTTWGFVGPADAITELRTSLRF